MAKRIDPDTLLLVCAGLVLAGDDAPVDGLELLGDHHLDAVRRMRGMAQNRDWKTAERPHPYTAYPTRPAA